jgi:branched-chain amino acid transport system ATP-binding protein
MSTATPLLEVTEVEVAYGEIQALWGVDLTVATGEVATIIGPNGAGKSTLLKAIMGVLPVRRGRITFGGEDVTTLPAHRRTGRHLALVPEGRQLWPRMTVEENLLMGAFAPALRRRARANLARVYELFPRLQERRRQLCGEMSGGEQQMCAIGRGLMAEPRLLMLDEPSLGLAPLIVEQVFQLVRQIADQGVTILIAAQAAHHALKAARQAFVMEGGRIVLTGDSRSLSASEHVQRVYLGIDVAPL